MVLIAWSASKIYNVTEFGYFIMQPVNIPSKYCPIRKIANSCRLFGLCIKWASELNQGRACGFVMRFTDGVSFAVTTSDCSSDAGNTFEVESVAAEVAIEAQLSSASNCCASIQTFHNFTCWMTHALHWTYHRKVWLDMIFVIEGSLGWAFRIIVIKCP